MKVLVSIILSFFLLFQTLQFQPKDIWAIGELVEHAQMHSEKYGDTVSEFLTKHYGSQKKAHYGHHSEHDELPFNKHSHSTGVHVYVLNHQIMPVLHSPIVAVSGADFYYSAVYSSLELKEVFQPPKTA